MRVNEEMARKNLGEWIQQSMLAVELVAEEVIMAEVEEDIVVAEELPEELAKPEGTLMGLETAFSMDTKADIEAIFGNILS